jgi:hypothetical protein
MAGRSIGWYEYVLLAATIAAALVPFLLWLFPRPAGISVMQWLPAISLASLALVVAVVRRLWVSESRAVDREQKRLVETTFVVLYTAIYDVLEDNRVGVNYLERNEKWAMIVDALLEHRRALGIKR